MIVHFILHDDLWVKEKRTGAIVTTEFTQSVAQTTL
jgi:hypothetical protein